MAPSAAPSHLFLFNTGDPNETPVFTTAGHFAILVENQGSSSTGKITLRALDNSWIAHVDIINGLFSGVPRVYSGELNFTTIKGTPPFPATLAFGPIATNENIQIISDPDIINNPNLIAFLALNSPPDL